MQRPHRKSNSVVTFPALLKAAAGGKRHASVVRTAITLCQAGLGHVKRLVSRPSDSFVTFRNSVFPVLILYLSRTTWQSCLRHRGKRSGNALLAARCDSQLGGEL